MGLDRCGNLARRFSHHERSILIAPGDVVDVQEMAPEVPLELPHRPVELGSLVEREGRVVTVSRLLL